MWQYSPRHIIGNITQSVASKTLTNSPDEEFGATWENTKIDISYCVRQQIERWSHITTDEDILRELSKLTVQLFDVTRERDVESSTSKSRR